MHVRKLVYLLMIEIIVAICNSAAQESSRLIVAKGEENDMSSYSINMEEDSENAQIIDSAQDVITQSEKLDNSKKAEKAQKTEETKKVKKAEKVETSTTAENEKIQTTSLSATTVSTTSEETSIITDELTTDTTILTEEMITENECELIYETQEEINNNYVDSDFIIIKGNVIPIAYGVATQDMVNTYDVVQDTGLIENTNNTILFGHNNRSFSILEEVNCGEIITLNNFGVEKSYQVEKSELGILSDDETDIVTINDGNFVIYQDYGFHALILITCANNYNWNYRWIIVARELD